MQIIDDELMRAFRAEAKRQHDFTNSFARQLAVILVAIVLINWLGPMIIMWQTQQAGGGETETVSPMAYK